MAVNMGGKKRLWTNYFTTAANATEQQFTFSTLDDYRTRHIESVFVGLDTAGVQLSLYTQGQEYSTIDLSRFSAGDAVLHIEFDLLPKLQLTIGLKNLAGATLTNVPVTIGYTVDPGTGP